MLQEFAGWRFLSDFIIPGASVSSPASAAGASLAPPEVVIVRDPVPEALDAPVITHPVWQVSANGETLLTLPGIARFLISEGCRVVIEPAPGADPVTIGFLVSGPVLAVLSRQRGLVPLDGAAVGWQGGALLIIGPSGQGKSSIAASLATRGWPVLADGVLAISPSAPALVRGWPRLRLWRQTAQTLGIDLGTAPALRYGIERYDIGWPEHPEQPGGPWPLSGIVIVLNRAPTATCERLTPGRAAVRLGSSLWVRPTYTDSTAASAVLQDLIGLAVRIPCWHLTPPETLGALGATADLLTETLRAQKEAPGHAASA